MWFFIHNINSRVRCIGWMYICFTLRHVTWIRKKEKEESPASDGNRTHDLSSYSSWGEDSTAVLQSLPMKYNNSDSQPSGWQLQDSTKCNQTGEQKVWSRWNTRKALPRSSTLSSGIHTRIMLQKQKQETHEERQKTAPTAAKLLKQGFEFLQLFAAKNKNWITSAPCLELSKVRACRKLSFDCEKKLPSCSILQF